MKKLIIILALALTFVPQVSFGAFAVGWSATSTVQGWVWANLVNGVTQTVAGYRFVADYFTATSTRASSFPYASSTAITATNVYVTKLGNLTSNGIVTTTNNDGTLTSVAILPIGNGGTNNSLIGASSTVALSDGTKYVFYKLSPANFTTANVSQWTNDAGYTTNAGTVTSVDMSVPAGFGISGNPVTTSGTLALARNLSANSLIASNGSGNGDVATSGPTVNYITATSTSAVNLLARVQISNFSGSNSFIQTTSGNLGLGAAGSEKLSILTSGNVGVGTTTPGSLLSVGGNGTGINFVDNATSTFTKGIDLRGGCFSINGTCVSGAAGSSASSTLLSDNNTWTGLDVFAKASTTQLTLLSKLFDSTGAAGSEGQVLKIAGGAITWGTDSTTGGAGSGNVATSTNETTGYVPYWTTTSGSPATIGSDSGLQYSASADRLTVPYASTTAITATTASTTNQVISSVLSSILKTGSTGLVGAAANGTDYTLVSAVTCVNQLLRALTASGGSTCATVANTDLANSSLTVNGTSISLGSSGTITAASSTLLTDTNTFSATTTMSALSVGSTAIGSNVLKVSKFTGLTPSNSESVGGYFNMNISTNEGIGAVYFASSTDSNRLVSIVQSGYTASGPALHVRSVGTATAVNIAGHPTGQGILKVASDGAGDANAAVVSTDASTSGFLGQLWFGKCGTSVTCWNMRDSNNTQTMTFMGNGNLGIGTTSPYAKLSVVSSDGSYGIVTNSIFATSTATSTFAGGIDAARVCLTGTAICLSAAGSGSGTVNSGTTGQFPYYASAGTAVSATSTVFVSTKSYVGIGTTTPRAPLDISGNSFFGQIYLENPATSSVFSAIGIDGSDSQITSGSKAGDFSMTIGRGSFNWSNDDGTSRSMTLSPAGRLGVGSTTPGSLLSIGGNGTGINFLDNSTSTFSKGIDIRGGCFSINGVCFSGGGGGSGTINSGTTNRLSYYTGATTLDSSGFLTVNNSAGWFGIGTTTPTVGLTIATSTALHQLFTNTNATNGWGGRELNDGSWTFGSTTSASNNATSTSGNALKINPTGVGYSFSSSTPMSDNFFTVTGPSAGTTNKGTCFAAKNGNANTYTYWWFPTAGAAPTYQTASCSGAATTTIMFE